MARKGNPRTIGILREWIKRAERGEIIGVALVGVSPSRAFLLESFVPSDPAGLLEPLSAGLGLLGAKLDSCLPQSDIPPEKLN